MRNISDSEGGSSVDEGIEIESRSGQGGAVGGVAADDAVSSGNSSPAPPGDESGSNCGKYGSAEKPKVCLEFFCLLTGRGAGQNRVPM